MQLLLGACALLAALVMATPASAQDGGLGSSSVTQDQYGDRAETLSAGGSGGELGEADQSGPSTSGGSSGGSLPFTGLDLALMGGAAAALLVGGVLMRRRLHPGEES